MHVLYLAQTGGQVSTNVKVQCTFSKTNWKVVHKSTHCPSDVDSTENKTPFQWKECDQHSNVSFRIEPPAPMTIACYKTNIQSFCTVISCVFPLGFVKTFSSKSLWWVRKISENCAMKTRDLELINFIWGREWTPIHTQLRCWRSILWRHHHIYKHDYKYQNDSLVTVFKSLYRST